MVEETVAVVVTGEVVSIPGTASISPVFGLIASGSGMNGFEMSDSEMGGFKMEGFERRDSEISGSEINGFKMSGSEISGFEMAVTDCDEIALTDPTTHEHVIGLR